MGFIYRLLHSYNSIIQNKKNEVGLKSLNKGIKKKSDNLILNVLSNFFLNTILLNFINEDKSNKFLAQKVTILNFILKNMPTILISSINSIDEIQVKKTKRFKDYKNQYKLFLVDKSTFSCIAKNYYYIIFFNRFFFSTLNILYFRIANNAEINRPFAELALVLKFFLSAQNDTKISFYNLSNSKEYLKLLNSYDLNNKFVSTSKKFKLDDLTYCSKKSISYKIDEVAELKDIVRSEDAIYSHQLINLDSNTYNNEKILFVKTNKLYNKGRFSRNKQSYRTGVIWCLWLTILTICMPFYYFYSFSFKFTYLWPLFVLFLLRFIFVYFCKYNYINSWKTYEFIKSFYMNTK